MSAVHQLFMISICISTLPTLSVQSRDAWLVSVCLTIFIYYRNATLTKNATQANVAVVSGSRNVETSLKRENNAVTRCVLFILKHVLCIRQIWLANPNTSNSTARELSPSLNATIAIQYCRLIKSCRRIKNVRQHLFSSCLNSFRHRSVELLKFVIRGCKLVCVWYDISKARNCDIGVLFLIPTIPA